MRRLSSEGPALGEQSSFAFGALLPLRLRRTVPGGLRQARAMMGLLEGLDQQGGLSADVMDCFDLVNPF